MCKTLHSAHCPCAAHHLNKIAQQSSCCFIPLFFLYRNQSSKKHSPSFRPFFFLEHPINTMGEATVNGDMPHSAVLSVSPTTPAPTTNSCSGSPCFLSGNFVTNMVTTAVAPPILPRSLGFDQNDQREPLRRQVHRHHQRGLHEIRQTHASLFPDSRVLRETLRGQSRRVGRQVPQ